MTSSLGGASGVHRVQNGKRKLTAAPPSTATFLPSISLTARARASGLRVSCTAVASARRRRERQRSASQGPNARRVNRAIAAFAAIAPTPMSDKAGRRRTAPVPEDAALFRRCSYVRRDRRTSFRRRPSAGEHSPRCEPIGLVAPRLAARREELSNRLARARAGGYRSPARAVPFLKDGEDDRRILGRRCGRSRLRRESLAGITVELEQAARPRIVASSIVSPTAAMLAAVESINITRGGLTPAAIAISSAMLMICSSSITSRRGGRAPRRLSMPPTPTCRNRTRIHTHTASRRSHRAARGPR